VLHKMERLGNTLAGHGLLERWFIFLFSYVRQIKSLEVTRSKERVWTANNKNFTNVY